MGARTLKVYDSPEQIIADRPKKPVRGRAARIAAYQAQRQTEEETFKPLKPAVEVVMNEPPAPAPAEPGPIVWAKPTIYDVIPYSWEQVQQYK